MDKEVVIDYIYGRRYRFVLKWDENKKYVTQREYRYEDLKEDEII